MLNLLKKTTPWMVASLFVATSVFGQDNGSCPKPCPPKCEPKPCAPKCAPPCPPKPCPKPCPQPCPPTQLCPQDPCCPSWPTPVLNAAYNYPARIQTRCPWDFEFDASFIYWQPIQENMELGFANTTVPDPITGFTSLNGNMINMDFAYKPGFQIGMGGNFDYDNWDMHLEYTWFHCKQHQHTNGPNPGQIFPAFGFPRGANIVNTAHEHWHLNMDIVDLDLGRWYYVGTKLTFRPSFGARAAWIRQNLHVEYENLGALGAGVTDLTNIKGKTRSWAIGAKAALDTNWMMGAGFRLYGNGEADLLFTKYTRLTTSERHSDATLFTTPIRVKQRRVYAVKPHLDLELGIGWGTYLDCNNWYMDFAAGYGFQVFFDQNMFRHFDDIVMFGHSSMPNGNLYIHGLTATFSLDF